MKITINLIKETEQAILVTDKRVVVWLRRRDIERMGLCQDGQTWIEIPDWLARNKKLTQ